MKWSPVGSLSALARVCDVIVSGRGVRGIKGEQRGVMLCIWCNSKLYFNTLRPKQNGRHFADDVFKYVFLNENIWISINISLKFFSNGPVNNIPALVQIMAWRRPGDKPLSEPMVVRLLTYICATRPQRVKTAIKWFAFISILWATRINNFITHLGLIRHYVLKIVAQNS